MCKEKLYKGKYIIAFYNKEDEELLYVFDNIKEILEFQKKEVNKRNLAILKTELYRALRSEFHFITFLTGDVMRVYVIENEEEENE